MPDNNKERVSPFWLTEAPLTSEELTKKAEELLATDSSLFPSLEESARFLACVDQAAKGLGSTKAGIMFLNDALIESFRTERVSDTSFTCISAQLPKVVTWLAEDLNLMESQVKALGTEGKLTAVQVYNAMLARKNA